MPPFNNILGPQLGLIAQAILQNPQQIAEAAAARGAIPPKVPISPGAGAIRSPLGPGPIGSLQQGNPGGVFPGSGQQGNPGLPGGIPVGLGQAIAGPAGQGPAGGVLSNLAAGLAPGGAAIPGTRATGVSTVGGGNAAVQAASTPSAAAPSPGGITVGGPGTVPQEEKDTSPDVGQRVQALLSALGQVQNTLPEPRLGSLPGAPRVGSINVNSGLNNLLLASLLQGGGQGPNVGIQSLGALIGGQ